MTDSVDARLLRALLADVEGQCLQSNPRQTFREVARQLGLSPDMAVRRVRALERSGFLRAIRVGVNPSVFGYHASFVYFRMPGIPSRDAVLERLRTVPGVLWTIAYLGGDGGFLILHRTARLDRRALVALASEVGNAEMLLTTPHSFSETVRRTSSTDWRIIDAVVEAPRRSVSDLASVLGISARTVRRHLDRLVADRTFFVLPDFDVACLEGSILATLAVFFSGAEAKRRFEEGLASWLSDHFLFTPSKEPTYAAYFCLFPNLGKAEERRAAAATVAGVKSVSLRPFVAMENLIPDAFRRMGLLLPSHPNDGRVGTARKRLPWSWARPQLPRGTDGAYGNPA